MITMMENLQARGGLKAFSAVVQQTNRDSLNELYKLKRPSSHINALMVSDPKTESLDGLLDADPVKSSEEQQKDSRFRTVYSWITTDIDVFTKHLVAVPRTGMSALKIARALMSILFRHIYVPETIISDLGTAFTSKLMHVCSS